jgi:hypothetical protein
MSDQISEEVALANSDNPAGLRLDIKKAVSTGDYRKAETLSHKEAVEEKTESEEEDDFDVTSSFTRMPRHFTID